MSEFSFFDLTYSALPTPWSPSPDNRNMTDGDIERCKKYRHFSVGSFIFCLVMVAALISMVNETLIDQLMDFCVSSVWLGFLLMNNKIFTVSPALIIAIYGSIVVFTVYRLFVFIPAVKRARAARASKLRLAQNFKRLKPSNERPRKGIARSCSALISKIMDNVCQLMDLLSNSEKISQAIRQRKNNEMWTAMNRPRSDAMSMALVSSRSAAPRGFSNLVLATAQNNDRNVSLKRRSAFRLSTLEINTEVYIPPLILAMRGSGVAFVARNENDVAGQNTAKTFFGCADDGQPSCSQDMPIVHATSVIGVRGRAKYFRANKGITSDPNVALRRLLSRYFLGTAAAERGDEISAFEEIEALNCTFYLSEIKNLLSILCEIYYPNNNILTEDERVEVFENFHYWWQFASLQIVPQFGPVSKGVTRYSDRVSFSAFSTWFLLVSETLTGVHTTRTGFQTI